MLLDDMGLYLSDNSVGTLATDLWLGNLPEDTDNVVAVFEYEGEPPLNTMNPDPGNAISEFPRVQILVRNTSYTTARTKMNDIFKLLDGYTGEQNGVRYKVIKALGSPGLLEKGKTTASGKVLTTLVCNFSVNKDLS